MDNNQPLSDAEIQAYVAADAALTTTKPWKLEVTSRRMKLYAFLAADGADCVTAVEKFRELEAQYMPED